MRKTLVNRIFSFKPNNTVYSLWIGRDLYITEVMSLKSHLYNGNKVILYVYGDVKNIPDGVEVRDAGDIIGEDSLSCYYDNGFVDENGKLVDRAYSLYSDMFRYLTLLKYGGWWSDLDVICLKPWEFESPYVFCKMSKPHYGTGVFKAKKDSLFLKSCSNACEDAMKRKSLIEKTGPVLLTHAVRYHKFGLFEVPPHVFYPFPWSDTGAILKDTKISEETYGVHLCMSQFSQKYDINATYDSNCLFEQWKKKYL